MSSSLVVDLLSLGSYNTRFSLSLVLLFCFLKVQPNTQTFQIFKIPSDAEGCLTEQVKGRRGCAVASWQKFVFCFLVSTVLEIRFSFFTTKAAEPFWAFSFTILNFFFGSQEKLLLFWIILLWTRALLALIHYSHHTLPVVTFYKVLSLSISVFSAKQKSLKVYVVFFS